MVTEITELPDPPSRNDPTTFSDKADALLSALSDFVDDFNANVPDLNALGEAAPIAVAAANYQGEYDPMVTYIKGHGVSYLGQRFAAKKTNLGITPVDGLDWLLIATDASRVVVTQKSDNVSYPLALLASSMAGAQEVYSDPSGGSYNPSTNTAAINVSGSAAFASEGGVLHSIVSLTSGTSWTAPAGARFVKGYVEGGSGAGGSSNNTSVRSGSGGGGGGAVFFASVVAGTSYTYSIGTGGASSGAGTGAGLAGGNTSITIGSTFSASGGSGGGGSISPTAGSPGSGGGQFSYQGNSGVCGDVNSPGLQSQPGGRSAFGFGRGGDGVVNAAGGSGSAGRIVLEIYK